MEGNSERECSALGGLFQQIINDMKVSIRSDYYQKRFYVNNVYYASLIVFFGLCAVQCGMSIGVRLASRELEMRLYCDVRKQNYILLNLTECHQCCS
jgi:hypothetical protein